MDFIIGLVFLFTAAMAALNIYKDARRKQFWKYLDSKHQIPRPNKLSPNIKRSIYNRLTSAIRQIFVENDEVDRVIATKLYHLSTGKVQDGEVRQEYESVYMLEKASLQYKKEVKKIQQAIKVLKLGPRYATPPEIDDTKTDPKDPSMSGNKFWGRALTRS